MNEGLHSCLVDKFKKVGTYPGVSPRLDNTQSFGQGQNLRREYIREQTEGNVDKIKSKKLRRKISSNVR